MENEDDFGLNKLNAIENGDRFEMKEGCEATGKRTTENRDESRVNE